MHPSGMVTARPKEPVQPAFGDYIFGQSTLIRHPGCSAGSPTARGGCRRGDTGPVLPSWLCGHPHPLACPFQGRPAGIFGFVVQTLDLLLPGLCVFVREMKDGWVSLLSSLPAQTGSFGLGMLPAFMSHRHQNTQWGCRSRGRICMRYVSMTLVRC